MDFFIVTSYMIGVAGAVAIIFSRTKSENLKDLSARVKILEKEREYAEKRHLENQKAISNLEGQLKTYKGIPLKEIAASLEAIAQSQNKILERMNMSADIAKNEAENGGLLVKKEDK